MSFNSISPMLLLLLLFYGSLTAAQQSYINNHQLDCNDPDPTTKGNLCNGAQKSCQSYVTFRSIPPYNSPAKIARLLGIETTAPLIASINNISSTLSTISSNKPVVIPVNCSCYKGLYYQHKSSYTIKFESENYFTIANNTYQGLTTCQALTEQNPYEVNNLYAGLRVNVPLRCACPTRNQSSLGIKYIISYLVNWGDYVYKIAELFNAKEQFVLDANKLLEDDLIYPFTPILVPVSTKPDLFQLPVDSPLPARPPQISVAVVPTSKPESSKKWVFVGIGVGVSVFVLAVVFLLASRYFRRLSNKPQEDDNVVRNNPASVVSSGSILNTIESVIVYKIEDIRAATGFFSEENRIKGSVFNGSFKGDNAAIKVLTGDVAKEINILKNINHANIVRLSGFCVHNGNTYLVQEFAENGSLNNWLHQTEKKNNSLVLSWFQRLEIAYNVADALNYLHNFMAPPFIHKNLNADNVLLDGDFRAKVANFRLAREVGDDVAQLTRHVSGTHGYMAPEYIENGLITPKLDVFAFGVVVLELLSGKMAVASEGGGEENLLYREINEVLEGDNVREKLRAFIDPCLGEEFPPDLAFTVANLARSCVANDPNSRPTMLQVYVVLSKIISSVN